ncbi:MAG: hypothetical protein P8049_03930 [Gemmatimonadota bacterium]
MSNLALLFPRLVFDRAPRAVIAATVLLSLTVPLLARRTSDVAAGFRDGLSMGAASGASTVIPIVAMWLALSAAWLADGVVSELRRDGCGPLVFTRPVSRSGYLLTRWLSGFVCLVSAGLVVVAVLNATARFSGIAGTGLSPVGVVGAAAASWWWVGSGVLFFSSLFDRGEAIAGALLLFVPISLAAVLPPDNLVARAAVLLPSRTMLDVSRTLLAGDPVIGDHILSIAAGGFASVVVSLSVAVRREWTISG